MRRLMVLMASVVAVALACGDPASPKQAPKPDPYITIQVKDFLDTTTTVGRSQWQVFVLLSGPVPQLNGYGWQGGFEMADLRREHPDTALPGPVICMMIGADSVGQRLVAPFAISDTTKATTSEAEVDSIVARWSAGNHAAPASRYMILTETAVDAWDSQQYAAGHGLTHEDPIKWFWHWNPDRSTSFGERSPTDGSTVCNQY